MKKGSIRRNLILVILPVVILCYSITFLVTFFNTRRILQQNASEQMSLLTKSVNNDMSAEVNRVLGIMENVKTSVEKACDSEEEIKAYIYGVADAYTDIIPAGIYCGLCSGEYIDKMWTPDDDWVMEERPWYQEGLGCDEVTFGEMYLDSNTGEYIISAFSNIRNNDGDVIGVICADIKMDGLADILTGAGIFDDGYVYAVDRVTGMIFGNGMETEKNGFYIQDFDDAYSKKICEMIDNGTYDEVEQYKGRYFCLSEVPDSNFVTVCSATKEDVEANLAGVWKSSLLTSVLGVIFLCVTILIALSYFLNPIGGIMNVIGKMHELDLTERVKSGKKDEFGVMADSMNLFADNLHGVMGEMKAAITEIDRKADVNAGIADEMNGMAEQQSTSLSKLMDTMSELSGAINEIAENTSKLSEHVVDTNESAELVENKVEETIKLVGSGHSEMENMTSSMTRISSISTDLQRAVHDVEQGLNGINEMVNVINGIVAQTSLLSLNASIEAARAGEAGRGFSVVADEIRNLAENCSNSVIDIVNTTRAMDDLVKIVTDKAAENMQVVEEGNAVVRRTVDAFHKINANIGEINDAIISVGQSISHMESVAVGMAASTEEQSAGTESVLGDCEHAMEIAVKFNAEGEKMAQVGEELKALSDALAAMVGQFKVD